MVVQTSGTINPLQGRLSRGSWVIFGESPEENVSKYEDSRPALDQYIELINAIKEEYGISHFPGYIDHSIQCVMSAIIRDSVPTSNQDAS